MQIKKEFFNNFTLNGNEKMIVDDVKADIVMNGLNVDMEVEEEREEFTAEEIFNLLKNITDPEHPLTLSQLNVVSLKNIHLDDSKRYKLLVYFTPTIPHCSMATLIGLCIRVKLLRSLPSKFKVKILISEGSHQSEHVINKQLNDKERVCAALENMNLIKLVNQCLASTLVNVKEL